MANVKHSGLTGTDLHEPKGTASANAGEVYIATGTGTGAYKKIAADATGTISNMEPKGAATATEFDVLQANGDGTATWQSPTDIIGRTYISIYPTTGSQTFSIVSGEEDDKIPFTQNYSVDLSSDNISWDNTNKVILYEGDQDIIVQLGVSFSVELTTGVGVCLKVAVEKSTDDGDNWTLLNGANVSKKFTNGDADSLSFTTVATLSTNDQLRLVRYIDTISTFTTDNININLLGSA